MRANLRLTPARVVGAIIGLIALFSITTVAVGELDSSGHATCVSASGSCQGR